MHEMTVQELLDYLLTLPKSFMSKKIMMDPQAPVGNLTDIVALETEDALLFKGSDDNEGYRLSDTEIWRVLSGGGIRNEIGTCEPREK